MADEFQKLVVQNQSYRSINARLKTDKLRLEQAVRALMRQLAIAKTELEHHVKMHGALPISERRRLERKFKK